MGVQKIVPARQEFSKSAAAGGTVDSSAMLEMLRRMSNVGHAVSITWNVTLGSIKVISDWEEILDMAR